LHILPDKTVICGHQRLRIAKDKEIDIKHLRCKTVYGLDTEQQIREYVILDNLLRRQLIPEKQAYLLDDLSKQYENQEEQPRTKDGTFTVKDNMSSTDKEDVNEKTAKKVNVSAKTVQRARAYVKAVKKNPKKYKNKKISVVLREERKGKDEERLQKELPNLKINGVYKTIVIDPPWETQANIAGRAGGDYAQMGLEEIQRYIEREITPHIDNDAHIYLWVINNRLHDAFHLLDQWGFSYKTIITWIKPTIGLGNYFRNNTEHLLFAVKGKQGIKKHDMPTWFKAKNEKHSTKPNEAYDFIERASYPPYLDVFARKNRNNWSVWGNITE